MFFDSIRTTSTQLYRVTLVCVGNGFYLHYFLIYEAIMSFQSYIIVFSFYNKKKPLKYLIILIYRIYTIRHSVVYFLILLKLYVQITNIIWRYFRYLIT